MLLSVMHRTPWVTNLFLLKSKLSKQQTLSWVQSLVVNAAEYYRIVFFSRPTLFVMTEFYRQFIQFVQFTFSVFFSTHCAER